MSFFKDTFKIYVSFHVIIFTKEFFFPNVLLLYMNAAAVIAVAPPLPSAEGRGFPHLSEFLHGLNITFLSFTAGRKGVIFPHLSEFLV